MTSNWLEKTIGDVCQLHTGGTPSRVRPEFFDNGDIPWLVSGDVNRTEIFECDGRITESGLKSSNAKYLPLNSVVIALAGQGKTRGTVALLRIKATCNQSVVAISPNKEDQLLPEFLFWNLKGRYQEIRRMSGDDERDRRGLNMAQIRSIRIPLPPLEEQKRIVTKLDKSLGALEERKKLIRSKLEQIGSLSLHLLRNSFEDKAKVDGSWKLAKRDDLFEFVNGRGFKTSEWIDSGLPIIRIQNLNNSLAPFNYFDGEYDEKILVKDGDLLYAWSGTVGSSFGAHVWQGTDGLLNQHIFKVNKKVEIDSRYARFALDSITADIELQVNGSVGLRHITKSKLLNFEIPFPTLDVQIKFVSRMNELNSEITELKETNTKSMLQLNKLQAALLASAFAGDF